MGGLFGGGKAPQAQKQQPAGALNVQTSIYGSAYPLVYGKNRVPVNLIHYVNFRSIAHTTKQKTGGKGGGGGSTSNTTYTYTVAFAASFAVGGPGVSVGTIWKNKEKHTAASLGLTVFSGAAGQVAWSYLTGSFPTQARPYANLAYIASSVFDLGDSPSLPNLNVEVKGLLPFAAGTNDDAEPSAIVTDYLSDPRHGAGFGTYLASLDTGNASFRKYCIARGLFISPIEQNQRNAGAFIKEIADVCNSAIVWKNGQLNIIPYGDTTITGNGATYTPDLTPLYDLTVDDFLFEKGQPPVKHAAKNPSQQFNHVRIEYNARENDYNPLIVEVKDQADIDDNGLRTKAVTQRKAITKRAVARDVAQLEMQRDLFMVNTYAFRLGIRHTLLEPMDFVTITEPQMGLDRLLVRIVEAQEQDDAIDIVAEEVNVGVANAPVYNTVAPQGYNQDFNASAGDTQDPLIMNGPGLLTQSGYEMWIAASGVNADLWGGCQVWVSDDDIEYRYVGSIYGPARYGALVDTLAVGAADYDIASVAHVQLYAGGQMLPATQQDCDKFRTLMYIGGEFMSYRDAVLVSGTTYDVDTLRRAAYGSVREAHAAGSAVALIDEAIFRLPYDSGNTGEQIYIKLPSFNVFGSALQDLADCTAWPHIVGASELTAPMPYFDLDGVNANIASALAQLDEIASDGKLTLGEQKQAKLNYDTAIADKSGIDAQADAYGLTSEKTAYDNGISTLQGYLRSCGGAGHGVLDANNVWVGSPDVLVINRSDWNFAWKTAYSSKQTLLNAIYAAAKLKADAAKGAADAAQTSADNANNALTVLNPGFEMGNVGWVLAGGFNIENGSPITPVSGAWFLTKFQGSTVQAIAYNTKRVPANPGDVFKVACYAYCRFANGTARIGVRCFDASGAATVSVTGPQRVGNLADNGFSQLTGSVVIPSGTAFVAVTAIVDNNSAGAWHFEDFELARALSSADELPESGTRKWAGESGADVTTTTVSVPILNPGFEKGITGWGANVDGSGGIIDGGSVIGYLPNSGTYSFRKDVAATATLFMHNTQAFPVRPLQRIRFTFAVRSAGATPNGFARLTLRIYDATGAQITFVIAASSTSATAAFAPISGILVMPPGAVKARVGFGFYDHTVGSYVIDDISVERLLADQDELPDGSTYARIKGGELSGGVHRLGVAGSGYQIGDQRNLVSSLTRNLGITRSATALTARAGGYVDINAHTIRMGGASVPYSAKSNAVTGLATGSSYYIYTRDNYAGGSPTWSATTNQNTVNSYDDAYNGGVVTIPSSGSSGGGSGGGGIGSCVAADMWLRHGLTARRLAERWRWWRPYILHGQDGWHFVRKRPRIVKQPCCRITVADGSTVDCSLSTPVTVRTGESIQAPMVYGHDLWTDSGWQRVINVELLRDWRDVVHIYVGGHTLLAGTYAAHRISTHNAYKN